MKIFLTFVRKQVFLMRRSTVLSLPLHLVFPAKTIDYRLLLSAPGAAQWSEKRYKAITIDFECSCQIREGHSGQEKIIKL
jgi:hypothetical protein